MLFSGLAAEVRYQASIEIGVEIGGIALETGVKYRVERNRGRPWLLGRVSARGALRRTSSSAAIVAKESTESFAADDFALKLANAVLGFDEPVSETLVISLSVIMRSVISGCSPK